MVSGTRTVSDTGRSTDVTTSAATPPTRVARTTVTRFASPSSGRPDRYNARLSRRHTATPYPSPVSPPRSLRPTVAVNPASTTTCNVRPAAAPGVTGTTLPPRGTCATL